MKHRNRIIPFILFLGLCSALGAAEVSFNIRYFDKRIYYLKTDPIMVQITLTNNGPAPYRFKLAEERAFSVDFDVRTTSNRGVNASGILVRKRSQNSQVFFREISVEAGESFSFVEDLRDYADINQSGSFVVQARIYPELYRNPDPALALPLESNRLSLHIRPPVLPGPDGNPPILDEELNTILVREKLPPDEVVSYLLVARQKEQWEKFFLYLDLPAMLSRDSARKRQWMAETEEGRQRMAARYRRELQSAVVDGDIATIPKNFIIQHTEYNTDEGTVVVLEYFQVGNYTEKKRYTYTLNREEDIWRIVDYSVVNLGTE